MNRHLREFDGQLWFKEALVEDYGALMRVDEVLYDEDSDFQNLLVFENERFGRVLALDNVSFEIRDNPMIRGEVSAEPICHWHASVFERVFQELVAPDCRCHETECCAQPGHKACRFLLIRGA